MSVRLQRALSIYATLLLSLEEGAPVREQNHPLKLFRRRCTNISRAQCGDSPWVHWPSDLPVFRILDDQVMDLCQ